MGWFCYFAYFFATVKRKKPESPHLSDDEYGFAHPAASRPQRIIWIPKDVVLGLGEGEVRGCEEAGVEASTEDARMDEKGKVDVDGLPPGLVVDE